MDAEGRATHGAVAEPVEAQKEHAPTSGYQRMIDYQAIVAPAMPILYWLIPVMMLIGFFKSPTVKGWFGELLLRIFTRLTLPKDTYRRLYNVTLPTPDGTTQIDHIFVSPYGIFVVETKNMKGWIFGSENQAQWTQKIYKRSYKFQNPLRQNYKHTKAIENLLDVPPDTIHSVVCFVGDSRFKTPMPANVTHGLGSVRYIKSFKTRVFSDEEVQQIVDDLQAGRERESWETHQQHVTNLRANHDSGKEREALPKARGECREAVLGIFRVSTVSILGATGVSPKGMYGRKS